MVGCQGENYWIGSLAEVMVGRTKPTVIFNEKNPDKAEKGAVHQLEKQGSSNYLLVDWLGSLEGTED